MTYDHDRSELENIAEGLFAIARALRDLGTGNAATPMGAIELLAKEVKDGCEELRGAVVGIGEALERVADIGEELRNLAEAVRGNEDPIR